MICFNCKAETKVEGKPSRQQTCAMCHSYLHCCRNCLFYDALAYHACREPQAEWVKEKEMGNFCELFMPSNNPPAGESRADEARRRLDELFGKKGG